MMNANNDFQMQHDEAFKYAAVDFLNKTGHDAERVAAELGVSPEDLREWRKSYAAQSRPAKALTGMAQLRAENEALRAEIRQLQVQWDILKTTLGVLSTTVGGREYAG